MRDIIFQEVGMENFGPYIEAMVHTFTNNTITLMTGPNGIGKTMSLDAIPFTFYGVTSKGAKGDDVVNNVIGKNCKTWVKFKINEDQYLVTRYQKYTRLGNTVILNKNGVDTKSGHKEVLPEIERLICPQKSFMNTLMFGQKVKDFFTDLVDSDKKEIFRKILSLEKYILYYKEADKRLKEVKQIIDKLTTDQKVKASLLLDSIDQINYLKSLKKKFYDDQKEEISRLKKELEENKRLSDNWKKELDNLEKIEFNLDTLVNELSKIELSLSNIDSKYQLKLNTLETQISQKKYELQVSADEAEKQIRTTVDISHETLYVAIETIKSKQSEITDQNRQEVHKLQIKKNDLLSDNKANNDRITEIKVNVLNKEISTCPTCEQDVNKKTIESLLMKVKGYSNTIEINNKEITSIENQIKDKIESHTQLDLQMKSQIKEHQDQIKELKQNEQDEYKKINERLSQAFQKVDEVAKKQRDELEEQAKKEKENLLQKKSEILNSKSEAIEHQSKIDSVKETIKNLENGRSLIQNNIKDEENRKYDSDQLLRQQQRELDLKSQIDLISVELKVHLKRCKVLEFWKSGFSPTGIPSMLIDEAIPFMNQKVAKYLDMITNGRYIVSFDTLAETKKGEFRDKISVRVLDTHTKANTRVQLSGGQTRIVDIATILTLGDLQSTIQDMRTNILLFDEIFDALDDENIGYVAKVLNKLKDGKAIFVIAHQHQDQVEADQVLSLS